MSNWYKVETAVIAAFHITSSQILSEDQKNILSEKLSNRINNNGFLQVKSQAYRTQLENKNEVVKKINELIAKELHKKKARIATKASIEKRIEWKKKNSETKAGRKRFTPYDE